MLVLMTFTRILFYIFNSNHFNSLTAWELVWHFIFGIKYDISLLSNLNSPFLIFSLMPVMILSRKGYQKFLKWFFCIANSIILAVNFIDIKLFEFSEKRLTTDIFNSQWLGDDFVTMLPSFLKDYWYILLMYIFTIVLFVSLYPRYNSRYIKVNSTKVLKVGNRWLFRLTVFLLFVLGARGGFQLKPLNVIAAAQYTQPQFIPLVLNSPFTLMKSVGTKHLTSYVFFKNEELDRIYNPIKKYEAQEFKNKNVVLIILESFGKEYSGFLNDTNGYTPNFDKIMQKGLTFSSCFANGKRSIESLPSILSSLPALMDNPFITSPYTVNSISSIASVLNSKNYTTKFYHGGKNGTMGFDNFVKLAGVENYYGLNEYPNKNDYDDGWGVFDEPYLQYVVKELNSTKEPFFSGIFTLSSHHPYAIPEKYINKFPKGDLVNHESIGYADFALGNFFKEAEKMPWYNNTIFILTADHTAQSNSKYYKSSMGRYAVPLVFFSPSDTNLTGVSNRICSHSDIYPSLMNYLGYSQPFIAFGESVFAESAPQYAAYYTNGIYQFIFDSIAIVTNGNELLGAVTFQEKEISRVNLKDSVPFVVDSIFTFHKAMLQQYTNRMIDNRLIIEKE